MDDGAISLAMRYLIDDRPALTATLRGTRRRLANRHLFQSLVKTRQFPFRPIISIHFEAFKLWLKKVPFYPMPVPPSKLSRTKNFDKAN